MIPQFRREKKKKREKTNKFGRRVSLNGKMWYNKGLAEIFLKEILPRPTLINM